jgi:hypothetical protein
MNVWALVLPPFAELQFLQLKERKMFRTLIHASIAFAVLFTSVVIAKAQEKCSVAGNAGTYAVKCNGYLTPGPSAPLVPATVLSKAVADKDGNWSGSGTLSLGGAIVTQNVQSVAPAQVNPDCTGSLTYSQTINGNPAPDIHFNFIVEKNSDVIDGIGTDLGSVFSCTLTRISK